LDAQRLAGPKNVFLPDKFVEPARPHAIGEGPRAVGFGLRRGEALKEAHG
jgi:hypothetical protein